jgi:hypothetical protein
VHGDEYRARKDGLHPPSEDPREEKLGAEDLSITLEPGLARRNGVGEW